MAPMTRARATSTEAGSVPVPMMATYYAQRSDAALIITEATQVSRQGQGYSFTPGIFSDEQVAGWREVTDAVHARGGRIFCQLWHVGRMSHASFHPDGQTVAPSALPPNARVWVWIDGAGTMVDCPTPRALATEEIPGIVEQFRRGAANAIAAGFDGVEIHGANGYLIDEFLRTTSNHRTDAYGGSIENRGRLAVEIAQAVADEVGADRVGFRMAPFITARGMDCPEIIDTITYVAGRLNEIGIAYVHLVEADWDNAPQIPDDFRVTLRKTFTRSILAAGNYDLNKATRLVGAGLIDVAAFGRPFLTNPDLPTRLHDGLPLADLTGAVLYGGGATGYLGFGRYGEAGAEDTGTDRAV